MAFQSKLAELIIRLKWLIIIIVVALSLFFGYGLRYITINPDIISSLPDGDQVAHLYKQIGNEFGGNDMGIIVLETDDVFTSEVLEGIRQITDSIQFTQGISYVTSMTNIMNITSSEWGIEIGKLVDEYDLPSEQKELDELRDYVMSKEMYKGTIISDDGKATAIMFTLQPEGDKQSVAREIKTKIEEMKLPWKLYFGGLPLMMNDVNDLILNDIIWLIPVVFIFIAGVLILSFQSKEFTVMTANNFM
jgi:predicted RND superfamily exporter protein